MSALYFALKLVSALGCGLVAGVFFAFSSFVMTSLARLPAAQGIAAMQSINVVVINVSFMLLLFGTAITCTAAGVWSVVHWARPGSGYVLAAALLYVLGTIGTTVIFNVPRNDALALLDPAAADSAGKWMTYVSEWTLANHVRCLAAIVAAVLWVLSLVRASADA